MECFDVDIDHTLLVLSSWIPLTELTAVLRGYQTRAVAWMMGRERLKEEGGRGGGGGRPLHMFWSELPAGFDQPLYFNHHIGK